MSKKLTGDLAQTSVGANLIITGSTSVSTAITAVSSIVGLANGLAISGPGIPAGATIAAFAAGSITLSIAATIVAAGVTLVVGGEVQILGLSDWSIDWKLKTADATTTDDSGYESSLPSTASWTAKAKYIYLDGDATQTANVRATIATLQRTAIRWNFFTNPAAGVDSYNGLAFIDGIALTAGLGKIVGMDVSLKGTGPLFITPTLTPLVTTATVTGLQAED